MDNWLELESNHIIPYTRNYTVKKLFVIIMVFLFFPLRWREDFELSTYPEENERDRNQVHL